MYVESRVLPTSSNLNAHILLSAAHQLHESHEHSSPFTVRRWLVAAARQPIESFDSSLVVCCANVEDRHDCAQLWRLIDDFVETNGHTNTPSREIIANLADRVCNSHSERPLAHFIGFRAYQCRAWSLAMGLQTPTTQLLVTFVSKARKPAGAKLHRLVVPYLSCSVISIQFSPLRLLGRCDNRYLSDPIRVTGLLAIHIHSRSMLSLGITSIEEPIQPHMTCAKRTILATCGSISRDRRVRWTWRLLRWT